MLSHDQNPAQPGRDSGGGGDRSLPAPVPASEAAAAAAQTAGLPDFVPPSDDPAEVAAHGRNLAALGLIHLQHAAAPRAMVLGLAAMAMGDLRPQTVLMVAEALLQAGDPAQAMTALERFDDHGAGLSRPPNPAEDASRHYLTARILLRQGRTEEARAALDLALERGVLPATDAAAAAAERARA